jgi:hypothetical protein
MSERITADSAALLRQASMTAATYLDEAIRAIDARFGEGEAEKRPELVAAFMHAAAIDLAGAIIARTLQDGLDNVAISMTEILQKQIIRDPPSQDFE